MLLAALLIGSAGTAFAGTSCGTNLEYEIVGTKLVLTSPDPTQPATIENSKFKGNTTITSVTLPENVWQIGSQAFMGCTSLSEVELGNVQNITSEAFRGCTSLISVVIPPTVTEIGPETFYGCTSLVQVLSRPYTAPTLGTDGFTGCATDFAAGLQICVPALASYNDSYNNWHHYTLTLCFLDENDEPSLAETKISLFRDTYTRTEIDIFRTLRKAGSFNTITLPFNVPDIEASPLAGAEVCEFVGATVLDGALQFDIAPLAGSALTAGTPYLIQWPNTGEVMTHMHFTGISWDNNQTADDAGTGEVQLHGFYGKTHISDDTNGSTHLNLFLQGGNELYWPSDGENANAKMLGFRAWFRINGSSVNGMPVRRGMPATLRIVSTPTGVEQTNLYGTADRKKSEIRNQKLIEDGHLIIIRNGEKYSINGQKL